MVEPGQAFQTMRRSILSAKQLPNRAVGIVESDDRAADRDVQHPTSVIDPVSRGVDHAEHPVDQVTQGFRLSRSHVISHCINFWPNNSGQTSASHLKIMMRSPGNLSVPG